MKILILCTANRCRSQMAHGILQSFDPTLEVYSAGVKAANNIHEKAIAVLKEINIDISFHQPQTVEKYLDHNFDYVISVCDGAKESCPHFLGQVKHKLHIGFADPDAFKGTDEEVMAQFRQVRDQIYQAFQDFYNTKLKNVE